MAKTVQFGISTLESLVAEVAEIDRKITSAGGTISAILKRAETTTLAAPNSLELETDNEGQYVVYTGLTSESSWADVLDIIRNLAEEVEEAFRSAVAEAAKEDQSEAKTSVEALKLAREAKVKKISAMASLLSDAGLDLSKITLPANSAPRAGGTRSSNGSGKRGEAGSLEFYRVNADGSESMLVKPWDVSLMAFRWFGKCGAENLKSALPAEWGKGFAPVEVTAGGMTHKIGARVVQPEPVSAETTSETPAEEVAAS